MLRIVLLIAASMALAFPATAQTSDHFAALSALDAAVFARTSESKPGPADALVFPRYGRPIVMFTPYTLSYSSRSFMQNLRDVRRYGGRISVPFSFYDQKLLLEGEGARDYGLATKRLDIGRLRLMKDFGTGLRAGFEYGLFKGNPSDLRGAPHIDREQVFGLDVIKTFNTH
jgi:hypothetical protein